MNDNAKECGIEILELVQNDLKIQIMDIIHKVEDPTLGYRVKYFAKDNTEKTDAIVVELSKLDRTKFMIMIHIYESEQKIIIINNVHTRMNNFNDLKKAIFLKDWEDRTKQLV